MRLKWKNLRDSYVKYLKFLKGATGSAKKFKNWPWAMHLEFLRDTVTPRPTVSNIPQSSERVSHEEDNSNEDGWVSEDSNQMLPPPKKVKPKISSDVDSVINYLENKKELKQKHNLDRIDNLFLSYAETFKKCSPRTQAVMKMEMAQMFGRAELREIDAQKELSSPSNASSSSWQTTQTYNNNLPGETSYIYFTNKPPQEFDSTSDSAKEWYEHFTT